MNSQYVYANTTLSLLETSWTDETLVGLDEDFIDGEISMATDNIGHLYVAYADWYTAVNQSAVFVRQSTDGGDTWSTFGIGYDSTHNMLHPSIAIDPYSNDIFVAVEREWTSSDHDIFVLRCVNDAWDWSPVANVLGSDDRFPSITSEYAYGEANEQYVSYEYVHSYNDRDLMFAKSTDHGATWSIRKLHGNFPDYNVHAQTSITNANGYIFIAYKWGADYNTPCEIRVERSTDSGNSWSQLTNVDGLPNGCSFPSIAATYETAVVMVAFQYDSSVGNFDVRYSFSRTAGVSWAKGEPLFVSAVEDETLPSLAVDGEGTTSWHTDGCFHVVCKSDGYLKYKQSPFNRPSDWSGTDLVSGRWVGRGLDLTAQSREGSLHFYPCVAWTDGRTRDRCYSYREFRTWTVDDDGPADFHTIQEGLDTVGSRDTIGVRAGTYHENTVVRKPVLLRGEGAINTTVDGNGAGTVIEVLANHVVIENFTVQNGGFGVRLEGSNECEIRNNCIRDNGRGIWLEHSDHNSIFGNSVTNNTSGIALMGSSNNRLRSNQMANNTRSFNVEQGDYMPSLSEFVHDVDASNTVDGKPIYYWVNQQDLPVPLDAGYVALVNCTRMAVQGLSLAKNQHGILLAFATESTVASNNVTDNRYGIALLCSTNNTISGNNVTNSNLGVWLEYSRNNTLLRNTATNNGNGIYLEGSSDNVVRTNVVQQNGVGIGLLELWGNLISENTIAHNDYGVDLGWSACENTLLRNSITDNGCGVSLWCWSDDNEILENTIVDNGYGLCTDSECVGIIVFHNNFADNTNHVDANSLCTWDTGYPAGGNYWSDYAVRYPSVVDDYHGEYQDVLGSDGVWDSAYEIDGDNEDRYPLVEPWGPPKIAGDIDGDSDVDIYDLSIAGKSYGYTCSHPGYNRQADITCDGRVDIRDIAIIGQHWGQVAP